jgi:molybdopterin molybdotransferase
MITYSAALELIAAATRALAPQVAHPEQAAGMAAADDVRSATAVPPFANAAMDGFALRSADTAGARADAPVRLVVAGTVAAGDVPPATAAAGSAWEVMTGAALPPGCDAVLPLERTEALAPSSGRPAAIVVRAPVVAGQNRRLAGEDFAPGDPLLHAGDLLSSQAIMALAATGQDKVTARAPPRLAVIATGSELATAGAPGAGGRAASIRDSNGPYLRAAFAEMRMPLLACRTVPDSPDRLAGELASLGARCDIIITTGGVSAGRFDFVPATVERAGGEVLFHNVAIRPGKPLLFARLPGGSLLFGLPGNPMAVAIGLRFFVLPAIRALMGRPPERHLVARAAEAIRKRESLTFFAKALAEVNADAVLTVRLLPGQESFKISPLLRANCWAMVPDGRDVVPAGDIVRVAPLLPTDFPLGPP